jgi:hypothetical protein
MVVAEILDIEVEYLPIEGNSDKFILLVGNFEDDLLGLFHLNLSN